MMSSIPSAADRTRPRPPIRTDARGATRALRLIFVAGLLSALPVLAAKRGEDQKAQAAFQSAKKAYDLGQFEKALAGYTEAYAIKGYPELLFNIAQCHRQLKAWQPAGFFYRRYLALSPRPPKNEALVTELISEVDRKAEEEAAALRAAGDARVAAEAAAAKKAEEEARLAALQADQAQRRAELTPKDVPAPAPEAPAAGATDPALVAPEALPHAAVPGLVEAPAASAPITQRWYFWGGVVAVVAAATTTAIVVSQPRAPRPGSLGEVHF